MFLICPFQSQSTAIDTLANVCRRQETAYRVREEPHRSILSGEVIAERLNGYIWHDVGAERIRDDSVTVTSITAMDPRTFSVYGACIFAEI